ncbi:MAG: PEP-CTERM sorting domain-containing protein [Hahellaceae bacterium]|nr:PEP-CTERM sorting domain-containing protein [Hahellaceae bacterium]
MKKILGSLVSCLFISSVNATPITIDFDDLASDFTVGAHYSGLGVTFVDAFTTTYGYLPGGTSPIAISHTSGYQPQPNDPIEAIFGFSVSSVSLTGLDVGLNGFVFSAYDAVVGGNLLATDQVFGSSVGVGEFFNLSLSATGIRRVEFSQVRNVTGDGVVFDNFVFDTDASAVPVPGSIALLGLGLAGLGFSRKRKEAV